MFVRQADKDLDKKLATDYGAPEYINETTGKYYDLIAYHNFTEFLREEEEGQIVRKTTVQEKITWLENHLEHLSELIIKESEVNLAIDQKKRTA